jgi:recombinational DNA repair protein RecT
MSQLQVINDTLKGKAVIGRLTMALGYNAGDENGKQEAFKYAASVLAEIEKSAGDKNKDLTVCRPDTIAQTMIDAARFRMMIDGRQHAHIVKYGNSATLQIGYRGYLAKIKEHYPDADFTVEPIWQGDVLKINDDNGYQTYTLDKASAFNDDLTKLQGILAVISYSMGDRKIQKITTMSAKEIEKVKGAAKTKYVWDAWYIEKAKAAAIKRAAKIHFAAIQGMQEIIQYDNARHFNVERPAHEVRAGSIIENLNKSLAGAEATEPPTLEGELVQPEISGDAAPEACPTCHGDEMIDGGGGVSVPCHCTGQTIISAG